MFVKNKLNILLIFVCLSQSFTGKILGSNIENIYRNTRDHLSQSSSFSSLFHGVAFSKSLILQKIPNKRQWKCLRCNLRTGLRYRAKTYAQGSSTELKPMRYCATPWCQPGGRGAWSTPAVSVRTTSLVRRSSDFTTIKYTVTVSGLSVLITRCPWNSSIVRAF